MLFNEEYDKSLWLILSGDSKNRDIILKFVDSIPKSLYKELNKSINWCKNVRPFYSLIKDNKGYRYWYSLNSNTGELCLIRYIDPIEVNEQDIFILSLFPFNGLENYNNETLGSISYVVSNVRCEDNVDCDKVEYSLVRTSFGLFLKKYREYGLLRNTYGILDNALNVEWFDNDKLMGEVSDNKRSLRND